MDSQSITDIISEDLEWLYVAELPLWRNRIRSGMFWDG